MKYRSGTNWWVDDPRRADVYLMAATPEFLTHRMAQDRRHWESGMVDLAARLLVVRDICFPG